MPLNWAPTSTAGATRFDPPGNVTTTNKRYTGRVTAVSPNLTFNNCEFIATGWSETSSPPTPGTELYPVIAGAECTTGPFFNNCTFIGGNANSAYSHGTFYRCYFKGGTDLLRVSERGSVNAVECVFDGMIANSAGAHTDCVQATTTVTNATMNIEFTRCLFLANDLSGITTTPKGNAAIQFGSYASGSSAQGTVTNCHFDGGQYAIQSGGQVDANRKVVFRNNTFGRNSVYGPISNKGVAGIDFDSSNVWSDTRLPV